MREFGFFVLEMGFIDFGRNWKPIDGFYQIGLQRWWELHDRVGRQREFMANFLVGFVLPLLLLAGICLFFPLNFYFFVFYFLSILESVEFGIYYTRGFKWFISLVLMANWLKSVFFILPSKYSLIVSWGN